ncbi:hypothetical protein EW146_g5524 [Bondarzewia mesenterica]|uniref:MARVEL domain-containing protein n=1 Tax=Bondarzewia mesenterica TaxID=1095465 RepID=A0A4S4LR93_9AGAM|nr:hypothetical protein EW146_g5524 [Bondarzewia mesenterica]
MLIELAFYTKAYLDAKMGNETPISLTVAAVKDLSIKTQYLCGMSSQPNPPLLFPPPDPHLRHGFVFFSPNNSSTVVFATIVLGLAADLISSTEEFYGSYYIFSALAVATAVLTMITLIPMLIIDAFRGGAFTSLVVVEVSWFSILWILWLSTGAYAADTDGLVFIGSSCNFVNPTISLGCGEFKAIMAFSFLSWIILMAYTVTLTVFAFIGQNRGNAVWKTTVRDASFLAQPGKASTDSPMMVQQPSYVSGPQSTAPSMSQHHIPMQVDHHSPSPGFGQV